MQFAIENALPVLERTPQVMETMLYGLADEWIYSNEGGDTWTPVDIIAHLIFGEQTDWIPRVLVIMGEGGKEFVPFDMEGHHAVKKDKTMGQLLDELPDRGFPIAELWLAEEAHRRVPGGIGAVEEPTPVGCIREKDTGPFAQRSRQMRYGRIN